MKHVRFMPLLDWNLRATWHGWQMLAVAGLFGFVGWSSSQRLIGMAPIGASSLAANVWDAFFLGLAGPSVWGGTILDMLPWFAAHVLFFYLVGDLANGELLERGVTILPLVGGRLRWWWGKTVTLLILVAAYTCLGLAAVLAGAWSSLPWGGQTSAWMTSGELWYWPAEFGLRQLWGYTFLLYGSTLLAMACLQTITSVITRRSFYGFATVSMLLLMSWGAGIDRPGLARWLPGSQSMLLRHTVFDASVPSLTMAWSLAYNTILALAAMSIGAIVIARMDIYGELSID
ncbi:MAG: hypothetical protein OEZ02_07115 [Anaerolineae bacterium]|nr:hypothetical protein [Anaerolineae bacterium]